MTDWEDKCWGMTRCVTSSSSYSRHELQLIEGGFCSFHWHDEKVNDFIVDTGMVRIVWAHGWSLHSKVLGPGDKLRIKSGVPHQFQVLRDGLMVEEYFVGSGSSLLSGDINRLTTGSVVHSPIFKDDDKSIWVTPNRRWRGQILETEYVSA